MTPLEKILERLLEVLLSKANARVEVQVSIQLGRRDDSEVEVVNVNWNKGTCPVCKGDGSLKVSDGVGVTCPKCKGTGAV